MNVHGRWETPAFDLAPVAPGVGPFVGRDFLRTWWNHRGGAGELQLVESNGSFLPLCFWRDAVRFLGEADLTDYHSPSGTGAAALVAEYISSLDPATPVCFDSLPREAAVVVEAGVRTAGIRPERQEHEVSAVLALPGSYDDWLTGLGSKQRHEIRRKLRRFEDAGGSPRVRRWDGPDAPAGFCSMHRLAGGEKGGFMDEAMEAFFTALHRNAGAVVDVVDGPGSAPIAAAFAFEDEDGYYLYNSAYDPAAGDLSPGIILLAGLIRRAVRSGRSVFDFLKGGEPYKFRLGAQRRPLYRISAPTGKPA